MSCYQVEWEEEEWFVDIVGTTTSSQRLTPYESKNQDPVIWRSRQTGS